MDLLIKNIEQKNNIFYCDDLVGKQPPILAPKPAGLEQQENKGKSEKKRKRKKVLINFFR